MNRNLYISKDADHVLANYQTILIQDINKVINGYINNIVCECLDSVDYKERLSSIYSILSKIAFEGSATFKFLNASVLAARVLKNEIDSEKLSQIIKDTASIWTESRILEVFASMPNIVVQKNYVENIYTVITVHKKL